MQTPITPGRGEVMYAQGLVLCMKKFWFLMFSKICEDITVLNLIKHGASQLNLGAYNSLAAALNTMVTTD